MNNWLIRQYCTFFGHDLFIPVKNPFDPIYCKRCGWDMSEVSDSFEPRKHG